jgi:hypothetical protein
MLEGADDVGVSDQAIKARVLQRPVNVALTENAGPSRDRCAWARIPGQGVADVRAVRGCAYASDVRQIDAGTPTLGG